MAKVADQQRRHDWPKTLRTFADQRTFARDEAKQIVKTILEGGASEVQIAGLLVGIEARGVTGDELAGMVEAMLDASETIKLDPACIDIVGTGGSKHRQSHALNISTMACIVAAAAGATVCKHGNRKASSTSGSFDFLEALGVVIDIDPAMVARCVDEIGLGFAFARTFHPAMAIVGPTRVELSIPTVFNLLGPLSHPGRIGRQVVGVASPEVAEKVAAALVELGAVKAWVVAGADGLDELSTTGPSTVFEINGGAVTEFKLDPQSFGLAKVGIDDLAGGNPQRNVTIFQSLLDAAGPEYQPQREVVCLNAAAGLVVADVAGDIAEGLEKADEALKSGKVREKLADLVNLTAQYRPSGTT